MKKPVNLVYGVDETPPAPVLALMAFQHVGLIAIFLVVPLILCREARVGIEERIGIISVSLAVLGAGCILQALPRGPIGARYLCPTAPNSTYLAPSLLALPHGGLPLVFGMTIFAGAVEAFLSTQLQRTRAIFPPEIAGLIVVLLGLSIGSLSLRYIFGIGRSMPPSDLHYAVAGASLLTMIFLNVWSRGMLRVFSVLIGMLVGYAMQVLAGSLPAEEHMAILEAPAVAMPYLKWWGWSFDPAMALPFVVAAVASSLKLLGDVTTCQKMADASWIRPETGSLRRGLLANGIATMLAGAFGTTGGNTSTTCIGIAGASGVVSRRILYAIGGILILLAFLPKIGAVLVAIPPAVIGATLLFSACFLLVNGMQIITSRLLDNRRILVIGFALSAGVAAEVHGRTAVLPPEWQIWLSSSVLLGTIVAVLLNLVFRIGVRQRISRVFDPGSASPDAIAAEVEDFFAVQGSRWGARRDVIDRAIFGVRQFIEVALDHDVLGSPIKVEAAFDEFNLDVSLLYEGVAVPFPERPVSMTELLEREDGTLRHAGFMLRRNADRIRSDAVENGGAQRVMFHFDH